MLDDAETMFNADDWMTAKQAQDELGYGKAWMAKALRTADADAGRPALLPSRRHPLDKRIKLVRRADVERLKALMKSLPRAAPRKPNRQPKANNRSR